MYSDGTVHIGLLGGETPILLVNLELYMDCRDRINRGLHCWSLSVIPLNISTFGNYEDHIKIIAFRFMKGTWYEGEGIYWQAGALAVRERGRVLHWPVLSMYVYVKPCELSLYQERQRSRMHKTKAEVDFISGRGTRLVITFTSKGHELCERGKHRDKN